MAASVSSSTFSAYNSNSLKTMNRQWDKRKWNQNKNRNKMEYEYEEEWRGTKMEDGEDVKISNNSLKQKWQKIIF